MNNAFSRAETLQLDDGDSIYADGVKMSAKIFVSQSHVVSSES